MATEYITISRAAGDLLRHALDHQLVFMAARPSDRASLTAMVKHRLLHAQQNNMPCTLPYNEFSELHRSWLAAVDTLGLADEGLEEPLMRLYFLPLVQGDHVHITLHDRATRVSLMPADTTMCVR